MLLPKISVIIPIYNVEKFLPRCLDSVLAQTFVDFEIICVNDGSPDNCQKILSDYADKDCRIRILEQCNAGLSVARNNGLENARGEYIYFLDSDDAIQPQLLEIAYFLARQADADMVAFEYSSSDGTNKPDSSFKIDKIKSKVSYNPLFLGCCGKNRISFNVWTKLFRKDFLNGIRFIPNIHFEDFPFVYAILAKSPKTIITSERLHLYTRNLSSISNQESTPKQIEDYTTGIRYIYDFYNLFNLKEELKFLARDFIPIVLKHQLGRCRRASKTIQPAMWKAFRKELWELNQLGMLCADTKSPAI